jgi:hypothetical protein
MTILGKQRIICKGLRVGGNAACSNTSKNHSMAEVPKIGGRGGKTKR